MCVSRAVEAEAAVEGEPLQGPLLLQEELFQGLSEEERAAVLRLPAAAYLEDLQMLEIDESISTSWLENGTNIIQRAHEEIILPFKKYLVEEKKGEDDDVFEKEYYDPLQNVVDSKRDILEGVDSSKIDSIGINNFCSDGTNKKWDESYKTNLTSSANVVNGMKKCSLALVRNINLSELKNSLTQKTCIESHKNGEIQEQNTMQFEQCFIEEGSWLEKNEDQNPEVDPLDSNLVKMKREVKEEKVEISLTTNLSSQHVTRDSFESVPYLEEKQLCNLVERSRSPFENCFIEEETQVEENDHVPKTDSNQSDLVITEMELREGNVNLYPPSDLNPPQDTVIRGESVGCEIKVCSVVLTDIRKMHIRAISGLTSGSFMGCGVPAGTSSCKICEPTLKDMQALKICEVFQILDKSASLVVGTNKVSKSNSSSIKLPYDTGKQSFLCPFCDFRTTDKNVLYDHKLIHGENPYKCNLCSASYSSISSLKRHVRNHKNEKRFNCELCEYSTLLKYNLKNHIISHSDEKPYKCKLCDFKTKKKYSLSKHMFIHGIKSKPFICEVCAYSCTTAAILKYHMMKHTGEKPFQCSICDAKFIKKREVERHMVIHTGEKPFKCDLCSFRCNLKSNLKHHLRTHVKQKLLKCNLCDYRCDFKSTLQEHLRIHNGDRPFKCELCSYESSSKGNLKVHMRTHTGQKPFKCDMCQHECNTKASLENHIRTHTGERPFKCKLCDFWGGSKAVVLVHMKVHSSKLPYKCELCEYSTRYKENLTRHMCTHSNEKPFKCGKCSYSSIQKQSLDLHMVKHSNKRPFNCDMCSYSAKTRMYLLSHFRNIHNG